MQSSHTICIYVHKNNAYWQVFNWIWMNMVSVSFTLQQSSLLMEWASSLLALTTLPHLLCDGQAGVSCYQGASSNLQLCLSLSRLLQAIALPLTVNERQQVEPYGSSDTLPINLNERLFRHTMTIIVTFIMMVKKIYAHFLIIAFLLNNKEKIYCTQSFI